MLAMLNLAMLLLRCTAALDDLPTQSQGCHRCDGVFRHPDGVISPLVYLVHRQVWMASTKCAYGSSCRDRFLHRRSAHTARAGHLTHVLFFIHLESRRVEVAGITQHPNERWMKQIARNETMDEWGFLDNCRYLIHDRGTKFRQAFR